MANVLLSERYTISEGDVRRCTIAYAGVLDRAENLAGTPVFSDTSGDLTISNVTFNPTPVDVLEKRVPTGQAVSFTLSGQLKANAPYRYSVQVQTSAGQTIGCDIRLEVA